MRKSGRRISRNTATSSAAEAFCLVASGPAAASSSWSTRALDDWCCTLENHFPGNRYLIPLLNAELNRRWAVMPPQVVDPELEANILF
jgi:hypothetical protein